MNTLSYSDQNYVHILSLGDTMTNIRTLTLLACVASYSLNTQAMASRALLTRIQARQALTRLTNARSFSKSTYTYNQHHEQSSHQTHNQTIQPHRNYSDLLKCTGALALGAAGYIGYDQYKKYELQQLYVKYIGKDKEDMLALAEAHSIEHWLGRSYDPRSDKARYYFDRLAYLLFHNPVAHNYLVDQAALRIGTFDFLALSYIEQTTTCDEKLRLIQAARSKLNETKLAQRTKASNEFRDKLNHNLLSISYAYMQQLAKNGLDYTQLTNRIDDSTLAYLLEEANYSFTLPASYNEWKQERMRIKQNTKKDPSL